MPLTRALTFAQRAVAEIIGSTTKALRPMNEMQLAQEEIDSTLGYHERMNRCMPHPHEGECGPVNTAKLVADLRHGRQRYIGTGRHLVKM